MTKQTIPFLDLAAVNGRHAASLKTAAAAIIDSGWYILGQAVGDFEKAFAEFNQRRFCVGTGNG